MANILQLIDKAIPLWEIIVIGLALFAIVLILVLWWAFGYNLTVVSSSAPTVVKPAALALSIL